VTASLPLPPEASVVGVGVDVVGIDRMRTALARTPGLAARVFSTRERRDAEAHRDTAARLACSFAMKEAVVKSLGMGLSDVTLRDIELLDIEQHRREGGTEVVTAVGTELVVGGPAASVAGSRGVVAWTHRLDAGDGRVVAVVVPRA
jgi:holo-[acyl-carrier protein] synthase